MNPSERGQNLYERWAFLEKYYLIIDVAISRFRKKAIRELDINAGDRVADIGCGHGRSLNRFSDAVGPSGSVIGVDYSAGMARRTQRRHRTNPSVSVIQADARTLPLQQESLDGALSSYTLSTIPDTKSAIESIYDALRTGGQLAVIDYNRPQGIRYHLVKYPRRFSYNWQGVDVVEILQDVFPEVRVSKHDFGSVVIAIATK